MSDLKKIIIFMVVTFKLFIYIVNETIWDSSLFSYIYLFTIFILSLPYILKLEFNKKSFIKTFIILLISLIMFMKFKEDNIFLYALIALIIKKEEIKEMVKTFFYSVLIIYIITVILGILDILPMNDSYRTINGETDIRVSLGFPNANAVFSYFIPIVLSGIYLYDKNKLFNIMIIIVGTVLFTFSKCRTGYYIVVLIVISNLLLKNNYLKRIGNKQFLMFFILSILLAILFGSTKYNEINMILSGRPWYYLEFIKQGPLVWGYGINENLILDNLYLRLLANYSIYGFILYYYIYETGLTLFKDNKKILFITLFFLLYGVFEAITVGNFILVIFIKEILDGYREESYEKN